MPLTRARQGGGISLWGFIACLNLRAACCMLHLQACAVVRRRVCMHAGVSTEKGWDMNSLCVPRVAKEAIGAICTLRHRDGKCMTVNVEYNQLDPLLRSTIHPRCTAVPAPDYSACHVITLTSALFTQKRKTDMISLYDIDLVQNPRSPDTTYSGVKRPCPKPPRREIPHALYMNVAPQLNTIGRFVYR